MDYRKNPCHVEMDSLYFIALWNHHAPTFEGRQDCSQKRVIARRADRGQRNETSRVAAETTKQRSLFERGSAGTRKNPGLLYW